MHCRVCGFPVERLDSRAGLEYLHYSPTVLRQVAPHVVQPAPLAQIEAPRFLCDFCGEPDPVWVYAIDEAQVTASKEVTRRTVSLREYRTRWNAGHQSVSSAGGQTRSHDWGSRWTCCGRCAPLLDAGDLHGLMWRIVEALPSRLRNTPGKVARHRAVVRARHEHTLAGMLRTPGGQPVRARITAAHPLGDWETAAKEETHDA